MTSPEATRPGEIAPDPKEEPSSSGQTGWVSTPPSSWLGAYGRALAVFAYFAVATVWLPSFLIGSTTDEGFREIVVTAAWAVTFGGGLWALRELQNRGWL